MRASLSHGSLTNPNRRSPARPKSTDSGFVVKAGEAQRSTCRSDEWRLVRNRCYSALFSEPVAESDHRLDLFSCGPELGAQAADVDVHGPRFDELVVAPDALEQALA